MSQDNIRRPKGRLDDPSLPPEHRSHSRPRADEVAHVRLIRKYAEMIDGVDLESAEVGDRLELSPHDADVLIAEGWAERAESKGRLLPRRAHAADHSARPPRKPKS